MSNLRQLTCTCGTKSVPFNVSSSLADNLRESGFDFVFDCGNGLDVVYLCPPCGAKVRAAWDTIVSISGTRYAKVPPRK